MIYDDFTHSFQLPLFSLLSSPSSLLLLYSGHVRGRTTASCAAALCRGRGKRDFENLWTPFSLERNKKLMVVYCSPVCHSSENLYSNIRIQILLKTGKQMHEWSFPLHEFQLEFPYLVCLFILMESCVLITFKID